MTRSDFRDWLLNHGCELEPLKESLTGNSIKVVNPKTNRYIFLDLPINERPVKLYYVCTSCIKLGIPVPDKCKHMEELEDIIRKTHYPNQEN